jgi:hypothetical protein
MKLKQLLSWRFSLIFFHRWLGIVVGLMFIIWTISGVILMYYGIPHYTAGERLSRLPPLDLSSATITPQQALDTAALKGKPFRLRISMFDGHPAYRINSGQVFGTWTVVFADSGKIMKGLDATDVIYYLAKLYPEYTETMLYDNYLREPDMFTHSPALQNHMPLHVIDMDNGDRFYVSEHSGEIVMHTTPLTKVLGVLGYNIHTLYFWRQQAWWTPFLHWISWIGLGMTILGIVLGIWRFSSKPQFIKRGVAYRTPYVGWWKWHHYAGLIFGVMMFTWMVSGLISMSVVPGIDETLYTPDQIKGGARTVQGFGAPVDYAPLTLAGMQNAVATIGKDYPVKELELKVVNGQPYYEAYRAPDGEELIHWVSHSAMDFLTPNLEWEHNFIPATGGEAEPFKDFAEADLLKMAATAMPGQQYTELTWLKEADDYYYHTVDSFDLGLPRTVRSLPVLRLKYNDPEQTWLYLTPSQGQLIKAEVLDRRNRWGYYGLHGFDFAFLYNHRPLWDIVVLILLFGCIAMTLTSLVPAWDRIKKHYFRLLALLAGN